MKNVFLFLSFLVTSTTSVTYDLPSFCFLSEENADCQAYIDLPRNINQSILINNGLELTVDITNKNQETGIVDVIARHDQFKEDQHFMITVNISKNLTQKKHFCFDESISEIEVKVLDVKFKSNILQEIRTKSVLTEGKTSCPKPTNILPVAISVALPLILLIAVFSSIGVWWYKR